MWSRKRRTGGEFLCTRQATRNMESLFEKTIKAAFVGVLLYMCWNILPPLKEKLVKKIENSLEKHGLLKQYKIFYKVVKTFLYIVIAVMILLPVLFFLIVAFSNQ